MFYSHEILTSPEHGVATIWLVATLGSRSITRRVNRRAILDVDVTEACRVIVNPQAPMALRLQGNLLYGVSRVYHQQCGYTLLEAQAMHDKMISMLKILPGGGLDPCVLKTKPSSLVVPYDPCFMPEDILSRFNITTRDNFTQGSNAWVESPPNSYSSSSKLSIHLNLGSDDLRDGQMNLGNEHTLSARKRSLFGTIDPDMGNEEGVLLQPDFEFDENGAIVEFDDSRLSPRKRRKFSTQQEDDGFITFDQNGDTVDTTADVAFVKDTELTNLDLVNEREQEATHLPADQERPVEEKDIEPIVQRQVRQRTRVIKDINPDSTTTVRNADLAQWNNEYTSNMVQASKQKQQNKIQTTSKKNAAFCVFGQGIGSVGIGLGKNQEDHPLKQFSGIALYNSLCEKSEKPIRSKRGREPSKETDTETEAEKEDNQNARGRGQRLDSLDIEIGRHAPSSLIDEHSSQMPWNIPASAQSSRIGRLGSLGELSTKLGDSAIPGVERSRRLTSASPLAGRGYERHGSLSLLEDDGIGGFDEDLEITRYLENELAADHDDINALSRRLSAIQGVAGQLDQESLNFFDFIQDRMGEEGRSEMAFSELLPPVQTPRVVATQGLMNVLTLATKGVLGVRQERYTDEGPDQWEGRYHFGEIFMRM